MASLVTWQRCGTQGVAKWCIHRVAGVYRVVGTHPGGAQVGLGVCLVVLEPWFVLLIREEPGGTWLSSTHASMMWQRAWMHEALSWAGGAKQGSEE